MKLQIPFKVVTLLFATMIVLSACTTNEDVNKEETPIASPIITDNQPTNTPEPSAHLVDPPPEFPQTKELEFLLEGMTEKVVASLTLSDQGYGFYLMDGFDFAMEEPGKDMIFNKAFPDYFARLELLPIDSNVDEVKELMKEQLKATGEVVELSEEELNVSIRDNVSFFIHSGNSDLSKNVILYDAGNSFILITLNFPNGEASEGISPRFYPMIQSLFDFTM